MHASGGTRAGRSHRARDQPCQDAYAIRSLDGGRVVAAVADGLGSRPLSHLGSDAACRAAVDALAREPTWDDAALRRAFEAARTSLDQLAAGMGAPVTDLATTLLVAAVAPERVVAGMVGDGAVVACGPTIRLLLEPVNGEYANEVVPLTHPDWPAHVRSAEGQGAETVLLFTDGLTRLLLQRKHGQWSPFQPFFDAFLPKVREGSANGDLVAEFLATSRVDESWDDDKCLVVIGPAAPSV